MLYSDVYVDEPLDKIIDDWDFMSEKVLRKFIGFRPVGDNIYGIWAISHDSTDGLGEKGKGSSDAVKSRKNLEIGPRGIVEVARNPFNVHVTLAGTPHHTQYLFGYWHINDKDEIIVPLPPTENAPGHLLIVMGHPVGNECDRLAWYCRECATLLFMREYVTGTWGFQGFWPWERATVLEFNSDVRHRTCPDCGDVHPLGYSGFVNHDTPEEREARRLW